MIPELDLPGHANGLRPLKGRGLQLCEPAGMPNSPQQAVHILDDGEGGTTRNVLADVRPAYFLGVPEFLSFRFWNGRSSTRLLLL